MNFNFTSIRKPRRMTLAVSGMVVAATLVAGAGSASAIGGLAIPDHPTTGFCDGVSKCTMHDADGFVNVARKIGGTGVVSNTAYAGQKDVNVDSEGIYDAFTVTDKRGISRTFLFKAPG